MSPFDHSRHDWYPDWPQYPTCDANKVCKSNGTPRAALPLPLDLFVVHYAGAGNSWLDPGDTVTELRSVEVNHARPSNKPNEYNSVSDSEGATWEYAGPYQAAHASGYNSTGWGHLALYGLEELTEAQAQGLIAGIRKARQQCVDAGYLTPGHRVVGHREIATTGTPCPDDLWTNKAWWSQITAPLTSPEDPVMTPEQFAEHMAEMRKQTAILVDNRESLDEIERLEAVNVTHNKYGRRAAEQIRDWLKERWPMPTGDA